MKKLFLLLSLSFLIVNYTQAQDTKKGLNLSFKGGLTLPNQYGKDAVSETFLNGNSPETFYANNPASKGLKSGVNIGGLMEYRFNQLLSFGVGINYIQKGSKINAISYWNSDIQEYEDVNGTVKWIQNYWTLDLPLKLYFPLKQNELYLLGGFTLGHLSSSKEKGNIDISGTNYEYTNDRGANKNESGFLAGFGYNYQLSNANNLFFEFVWNRSLGKSYGSELIPIPKEYYNQTFNLSIGYKFNLNK